MKCIYFLALVLAMQSINPVSAVDSPSARLGATMFYDSVNQRMLLFGGGTQESGITYFTDMWSYDYVTDTWTELLVENVPRGFSLPATFDPDTKRLYVLDDDGGMCAFDVENDVWVDLGPSGILPWRGMSSFGYDERYRRIILFSGMTGTTTGNRFPADTWAYDPVGNSWEKMSPSSSPGGRYGHSIVYDPIGQRMLMIGGHNWTNTTPRIDSVTEGVWSYDYGSDAWSRLDSSSVPTRRYWHAYSVNTDTGELMVCGGVKIESFLKDTWLFGDGGWSEVTSEQRPEARQLATAAYDPVNKVTLLFGGGGYEGGQLSYFGDLWALDASGSWRQLRGEGATTGSPETDTAPVSETSSIQGYPIGAILIAITASLMIQRGILRRS
jgi:hypothetical protein